MTSENYPPDANFQLGTVDRGYQDEAAVELYKECGGSKLVGALSKLHQALQSQAAKLEEFFNTPYSEDNARLIKTTVDTINAVELQIERWHYLIYPNQRSGEN